MREREQEEEEVEEEEEEEWEEEKDFIFLQIYHLGRCYMCWLILCIDLTGCSDSWLNNSFGCVMRMPLKEISIYISRLSKGDCPPQWEWASPNLLKS